MAEFAIRKVTTTIGLAERENLLFQEADIALCYPDGTLIENPSPNTKLYWLRVPEIPYQEGLQYIQEQVLVDEESGLNTMVRKRVYTFNFGSLPIEDKAVLDAAQILILTRQEFENLVVAKE